MKVQNPIIGRARGSAGGMTFCKNYDKNVARAKAFEVSNPKTQAQLTQRNFFAQLTALCSDFSEDQLRTLFPSKPKTMSRRNALSKQIAQSYNIDGTEKTIDFEDIDTLGNAPVMDFGNIGVNKEQDRIEITYADFSVSHQELADNDMMFALLNTTKKEIVLTIPNVTVSDEQCSIQYPSNWTSNDTISAIPFVLNSKGGTASEKSWGTISVTKRPARKND